MKCQWHLLPAAVSSWESLSKDGSIWHRLGPLSLKGPNSLSYRYWKSFILKAFLSCFRSGAWVYGNTRSQSEQHSTWYFFFLCSKSLFTLKDLTCKCQWQCQGKCCGWLLCLTFFRRRTRGHIKAISRSKIFFLSKGKGNWESFIGHLLYTPAFQHSCESKFLHMPLHLIL